MYLFIVWLIDIGRRKLIRWQKEMVTFISIERAKSTQLEAISSARFLNDLLQHLWKVWDNKCNFPLRAAILYQLYMSVHYYILRHSLNIVNLSMYFQWSSLRFLVDWNNLLIIYLSRLLSITKAGLILLNKLSSVYK